MAELKNSRVLNTISVKSIIDLEDISTTDDHKFTFPAKSGELVVASDLASFSSTSHTHVYLTSSTPHHNTPTDTTTPNDYNGKFYVRGLYRPSQVGLDTISSPPTYTGILGIRPWSDSSGGEAHEFAVLSDGRLYHRSGGTTEWDKPWEQILTSGGATLTGALITKNANISVQNSGGSTVASINTNGYVTGTWLQTTAANGTPGTAHSSGVASKIAVIDSNGWIYYRTPEEIRSDIGASTPYSLPVASSTILGGVKLGSDTQQNIAAGSPTSVSNRTYPVQKNASGQLVVNVPWQDTNTTYDLSAYLPLSGSKSMTGHLVINKAGEGIGSDNSHIVLQKSGTSYGHLRLTATNSNLAIESKGGIILYGGANDNGTAFSTENYVSVYSGSLRGVGTVDLTGFRNLSLSGNIIKKIDADTSYTLTLPNKAGTVALTSDITSAIAGKANTSHTHSASDITSGTLALARIPTGTTSSTVALGNHTHSGYASSSHTHSASDITSGQLNINRIPTGTSSSTVALGNHTHSEFSNLTITNSLRMGLDSSGSRASIYFGDSSYIKFQEYEDDYLGFSGRYGMQFIPRDSGGTCFTVQYSNSWVSSASRWIIKVDSSGTLIFSYGASA